ncbi:hypothetical protein ABW21_db0207792 [Orbilia brochopaga]|nr:hypothetical protein ABW21_db0207792 [Drechslerella brochopaga]
MRAQHLPARQLSMILCLPILSLLNLVLPLPCGLNHLTSKHQSNAHKSHKEPDLLLLEHGSDVLDGVALYNGSQRGLTEGPTACPLKNATGIVSADMPTAPTRTRDLSTSPHEKREEGGLSPAWFFTGTKGSMRVHCLPQRYVYNNIDPYAYKGETNHKKLKSELPEQDFPGLGLIGKVEEKTWGPAYYWSKSGPLLEAYAIIKRRQDACLHCHCDDNGRLVPALAPKARCHAQWQADECAAVYACICWARLGQPKATSTSLTIDDYQRALDAIPGTIREGHKDWAWKMNGLDREPGQTMKWTNTRVQVNDPDLKEPYYLEGPSDRSAWNWLTNPNRLVGGGFADALNGGLSKREVMDIDAGAEHRSSPAYVPETNTTAT